jgi:hypothetical protein
LNINGREGPILKKVFTCDGCKWFGDAALSVGRKKYRCNHYSVIHGKSTSFELMMANIDFERITPDFCPFLMLKMRNEKLKELNNIKN